MSWEPPDEVKLEAIQKENKFVYRDSTDTPCVLCGNTTRIRIGNTLLSDESNPQCVNEWDCLMERNGA